MMELAQIETMRQQKIAAESSIRMTEERISQEAAATERFRMRQEEMYARNLEYVRRALEFRQETTLVFTIVTAIFLPLNFFTSVYIYPNYYLLVWALMIAITDWMRL